jgi:hypothetical protein
MRYEDEAPKDDGSGQVRSFLVTKGQARVANGEELAPEALVEPSAQSRSIVDTLQFERRSIVAGLSGPTSVAEVAAHLKIPLLTAQVLLTNMVGEGLLNAQRPVQTMDLDFLSTLRAAITNL